MTYIISPQNSSLTASTWNILVYLDTDAEDIGYYTSTSGEILQEKQKCNFTYTISGNTIQVFNSVNRYTSVELENANYTILWGDGQSNSVLIEQVITHTYSTAGTYELTLGMETPWNTDKIIKTVTLGQSDVIENPLGTLTIVIPFSEAVFDQNYITNVDGSCQNLDQDDVFISGFTQTRLKELFPYGDTIISVGLNSDGNGVVEITDGHTGYTIDGVLYIDFSDGLTYYNVDAGENPLELICQLITKEEALLGIVNDIEVQSDVFVERGKVSVFEHNMRLSDLDSTGEAEVYGNGYFNITKTA